MLTIDDSATYLEYLAGELGQEGYRIEQATDGEQGLARLRQEPFDCVLVDLVMPGLNGIEVCRHLKSNPETQAIRILGVTGYPAAAPGLLAAGADAVLTKPLALDEVESHLGRLLD